MWTSIGSTPSEASTHRIAAASASESRPPEKPTTIRSPAAKPTSRAWTSRRCSNPSGVCRRVRPRGLTEGAALPDRSPRVEFLVGFTWCRRVESNHRPRAYESLALPLSYVGKCRENGTRIGFRASNTPPRERPAGRDPASLDARLLSPPLRVSRPPGADCRHWIRSRPPSPPNFSPG